MKRRSFLLGVLGVSTVGVSLVNFLDLDFADKHIYAKPTLLSRLCDDETIQLLGQTYLETAAPLTCSRDQLMKSLYGGVVNTDTLLRQDKLRLRVQPENSIKEDFAAGAIVILKGWVLSVTEARQCALYSILNT